MKYLKAIELFAVPLIFAGLTFYTLYTLNSYFGNCQNCTNYLPLFGAISFFAFFAFFVPTANILFPPDVIVLPIKRNLLTVKPEPCIFTIVKSYQSPVTNIVNLQTI